MTTNFDLAVFDNITPPSLITGAKYTLWDLFLDMGVTEPKPVAADAVQRLAGLDVVYDETVPVNTVQLRGRNNRLLRSLVQVKGQWYVVDHEVQGFTSE